MDLNALHAVNSIDWLFLTRMHKEIQTLLLYKVLLSVQIMSVF